MFRRYYFRKPFLTAFALMLLGAGLGIAGIRLAAATHAMDYYAMVVLGGFLFMAGVVTFAMYYKLEKEYRRSVGGTPLLRYTVANKLMRENMERQIKTLRSSNRGLLLVMLLCCAVLAIILPFVLEDGRMMFFICLGLGAVLFAAERIITGYRVRKLQRGTGEYILTENGAVVGGEFHCWNVPGLALTGAAYTPADGADAGVLQIEYAGRALAGEQTQRLFLPIPKHIEKEIPGVLAVLESKIG